MSNLYLVTINANSEQRHASHCWKIEGNRESQEAILRLRRKEKPESQQVLVISTAENPVVHLDELLVKLADAGCEIDLRILESFRTRKVRLSDCDRMEKFINTGHGSKLKSFYGYVTYQTRQHMEELEELGLHLKTDEDMESLSARDCKRNVSVDPKRELSGNNPLQINFVHDTCLTCVKLEDDEIPSLMDVAEKLVPKDYPKNYELHLPKSRLTKNGVLELMSQVGPAFKKVCLESEKILESDRSYLEEQAKNKKLTLSWKVEP